MCLLNMSLTKASPPLNEILCLMQIKQVKYNLHQITS